MLLVLSLGFNLYSLNIFLTSSFTSFKELIELLKPKNPDYVMLLDADEIPTPSIIQDIL